MSAPAEAPPLLAQSLTRQLQTISEQVNAVFYERRTAVEALVLAVLAKQHAFVLGPPGSGKSQLVREVLSRIEGASYFEQLLSKTRPDQAVLGPYDLPLLRDAGQFHRRIDGFLLSVNYAFLDEIGKMSPTLGHDLLAALNERVRHEVGQGNSVHPIPLYSAITASNELPSGESDDAEALWDRLLVRTVVDYIGGGGHFSALLAGAVQGPAKRRPVPRATVSFAELAIVVDTYIPTMAIPGDVLDAAMSLREELRGHGIRASDRRWRQSMRVLQANAFLNGRSSVEVDDLGALRHTLWETPEQRTTVERAALKIANPLNEETMVLLDTLAGIRADVLSRKGKSLAERAGYGTEALAKLKSMERTAGQLKAKCEAAGLSTSRADEVSDEIVSVRRTVLVECLDVSQ